MRPARILLRLKRKQSRTVKAFTNVRDCRCPHARQLHLGYFGIDEGLDAHKDALFRALVAKWPRMHKPKAIDWSDADMKLTALRRRLEDRDRRSPDPPPLTQAQPSSPESPVSEIAATTITPRTSDTRLPPSELAEIVQFLRRMAILWLRDTDEADDLVQATVERALRSPRQLAPGSNRKAWMMHIMRNLHIDHCRRRSRDPQINVIDIEDVSRDRAALQLVEDPWLEVDEPWRRFDQNDILEIAQRLPLELYKMIRFELDGFTYREMADILQMPFGTAVSRLHRARVLLRELIEQRATRLP